jgi:hypothetical protein
MSQTRSAAPSQRLNYDDCLNRGGHFWPADAPKEHSVPCEVCGFDPGWVGGGENAKNQKGPSDGTT